MHIIINNKYCFYKFCYNFRDVKCNVMLKGLNIGLECPDFNGWPSTENVIAMIFCDDDAVVADKNYKYHLHTIIARHNAQRSGGLCSQKCIPVSIWQVYFYYFEAWGREVIPFPLPKYCHVLSTNLEREGVLRTTTSTGRYDSPREVSKLHAHWFWQLLHASCKTRTPGQLNF